MQLRCREATALGMEGEATHRIDSGLPENEGWQRGGRNGEKAEVFSGAGCQATPQATPGAGGGSAEFGADREVFLSQKKEKGVGSGVGIEAMAWMSGSRIAEAIPRWPTK